MEKMTKVWIGLGALVVVGGGLGLYEHYKAPAAPPVLTGNASQVLTPGTMPNAILSIGKANTYTFSLPAGASFSTVSGFSSSNPSVIDTAQAANTSPVTLSPLAIGQTVLTLNWIDSKGTPQVSTVMITVQS